jgi:hypothetical protein
MEGISTKIKLIILALLFWVSAPAQMFGSLAADDYNAAQVIQQGSITGTAQRDALVIVAKDLKAYSLWSKFYVIYGFTGGTSTSNALNLVNTSQYSLTFTGGPTHALTGTDWNGSTQYAATGFTPSSISGMSTSNHFSIWVREITTTGNADENDIGAQNGSTQSMIMSATNVPAGSKSYTRNLSGTTTAATTPTAGWYVSNKISSANNELYRNGSLVASNGSSSGTLPTLDFYIGTIHLSGGAYAGGFINRETCLVTIGSQLTSTEIAKAYTIFSNFNTKQSR